MASVCCLAGLPGSGKTTIARLILELNQQCCGLSCKDIEHVHSTNGALDFLLYFDKIVLIDYDALTREQLTLKGDIDAAHSDPPSPSFDPNELDAWRKSRSTALDKLKAALTAFAATGDASTLLIILDDNFHLRSMRREIYRSCQEIIELYPQVKVGFSVVYVNTPLEYCLRRNDLRSGKERIPRNVINRMSSVMEPPDETKACASFDRFHVSIDNSEEIVDMKTKGRTIISEVYHCIQKSLRSPVVPKRELSREEIDQMENKRMRDREETNKSEVQRIDQLLRKFVGAVGRVDKKKSKEANEIRKSILETIRKHADMQESADEFITQQFVQIIMLSPKTRPFLNDKDFMAKVHKLQRDPNSLTEMISDPKIIEVLGLALGGEVGDSDMDDGDVTAPSKPMANPATEKEQEKKVDIIEEEGEEDLSQLSPAELKKREDQIAATKCKERGDER